MEFSEDPLEMITVDVHRRVFVVAAGAMRRALTEQLSAEGFEVRETEDASAVIDALREWKPDVVLIEEVLPGRSGRQVVLSIRAHGEMFGVAIAGVLTDVSVPNVLQWMRVGATDIWRFPFTRDVPSRTRELIDECDRSQVQLGLMKARLLAWVGRAKLSGTFTSHPGTPFEGRATFAQGELVAAQFGSLSGMKALEQMLELDDGPVTWDEAGSAAPAPKVVPLGNFRARVLVVEDDPTIRKLVSKQLENANYQVEAIADGQAGLQLATQKPWDIVVADLDLPRLDGWGLLREMRADVALREVAVMMLSAHEGSVETLKAARSGARAYLKKSGRSKELLDAVALLATPRARTWNGLSGRAKTKVELRSVGAIWLVRALAELDCQGKLELEDALGRYELLVSQGQLVDIAAQTGSLRVNGAAAFHALLASRGEGTFTFEKRDPPQGARWLYEVIDEACDVMRREESRKLRDAVAQPGKLFLNEELAVLFARVANVAELKVLDAVKASPDHLDALSLSTALPVAEVELALAELLRRGVLSTQ